MCRLLHVEWRCHHKQNIWEYCRDATAPSRTPSVTERSKQPCEAFVQKYTLTPSGPTEDEYRNFCCKFVCCLEDQADTYKAVQELETALGLKAGEALPRVPSVFLGRQKKELKVARRKFGLLVKRHEERCEALYYGLGVVQEGDTWRAPAEEVMRREREEERMRWVREEKGRSVAAESIVEVREDGVSGDGEVVDRGDERPVEQVVEAGGIVKDGEDVQKMERS